MASALTTPINIQWFSVLDLYCRHWRNPNISDFCIFCCCYFSFFEVYIHTTTIYHYFLTGVDRETANWKVFILRNICKLVKAWKVFIGARITPTLITCEIEPNFHTQFIAKALCLEADEIFTARTRIFLPLSKPYRLKLAVENLEFFGGAYHKNI